MPRKPPDVSFESWIDAQVRAAEERGEFADLPGKGKPLSHLDDAADPLWWAKQLLRREGLSLLPPSLEIQRKVERFREALAKLPSEAKVREAVAVLNAEIRKLNRLATSGPPTQQALLDPEEVVVRWRELQPPAG
jgi:hypothetical protein